MLMSLKFLPLIDNGHSLRPTNPTHLLQPGGNIAKTTWISKFFSGGLRGSVSYGLVENLLKTSLYSKQVDYKFLGNIKAGLGLFVPV